MARVGFRWAPTPRKLRELSSDSLTTFLERSPQDRLREYRYRCAQSLVFGLPVIALHLWGRRLGGDDAPRWVWLLQALLGGWVVYVGATGMLIEGLLLWRKRVTIDLIVSAIAILLWVASATVGWMGRRPGWFHVAVMLIACWTGWQWARLAQATRNRVSDSNQR
jgi:cation transport ATPase